MDKLKGIIALQGNLANKIIEERSLDYLKEDEERMLSEHKDAILAEVVELQNELNFKWWVNDREIDTEACAEELIDILHFTFQALILLGLDAEDIYRIYTAKNAENHNRQNGKTERVGYNPNSDEVYQNVD